MKITVPGKFGDSLVPFILGVISIILALILSLGYEKIGFSLLIIGLFLVIILVVVNTAFVSFLTRSAVLNEIKVDIATIMQFLNTNRFPWLWTVSEVIRLEKNSEGSEIWIISPDLTNDIGEAPIIPIVKSNAARGIKYTYIVPNKDDIIARISELDEIFRDFRDKRVVIYISNEEFNLLSSTHVAIYNPRSENRTGREVLLELPIEGRNWWVKMSTEDADLFIGKIMRIIDNRN